MIILTAFAQKSEEIFIDFWTRISDSTFNRSRCAGFGQKGSKKNGTNKKKKTLEWESGGAQNGK